MKPSRETRSLVQSLSTAIEKEIAQVAQSLGVDCEVKTQGSVAKRTYLEGHHDIDIFVFLPETARREFLEEKTIEIGKRWASEKGLRYEIAYAEHPYVRAWIEHPSGAIQVDIVGAFMVSEASKLKSAVDRTRFHTEYVLRKTDEKIRDQILLTKQFMKGIGVYGSEAKVGGFSGLLCEVLTIAHGSFLELVKSASRWSFGQVVDVEAFGEKKKTFDSPLVVLDPTDPGRNAAAAVSASKLARFIHACRRFLQSPSQKFFFPLPRTPFSKEMLRHILEDRGTRVLLISFERPRVLDDIFYPQLERMISWMRTELHRHGFLTAGPTEATFCEEDNQVFILFEVEVPALSSVKKTTGPVVENEEHGARFLRKHRADNTYLEGDQWYVDSKRRFTTPESLILFLMESRRDSIPSHIRRSVSLGWNLLRDREVVSHPSKAVRLLITQHFSWKFPWEA